VIGLLAAVENVFPPVPADTAVVFGAFLAGRGTLNPWAVFGVTWVGNVASAALVYAVARRYGRSFFSGRLGRRLLPEPVVAELTRAYERHGAYGIFLSRLLPVWRGIVPPFAGIAGVGATRALVPLALASALWYGALIYLTATFGANLDAVSAALSHVNRILGTLALVTLLGVTWYTVRRLKRWKKGSS
jgi:membrane protein DedA with SNARE-associated domain